MKKRFLPKTSVFAVGLPLVLFVCGFFCGTSAFAADFKKCEFAFNPCDKPKTCAVFYACQKQEYRDLNDLVYAAIKDVNVEALTQCREKRESIEDSIFAHATTIECFDTPEGPEFGG